MDRELSLSHQDQPSAASVMCVRTGWYRTYRIMNRITVAGAVLEFHQLPN